MLALASARLSIEERRDAAYDHLIVNYAMRRNA
jgi:hypothetical protein